MAASITRNPDVVREEIIILETIFTTTITKIITVTIRISGATD